MKSINMLLSYKKLFGAILLFMFVFSANVLFLSAHFVEEFGHGQTVKSLELSCAHDSASASDDHHHQGEGQGTAHHGDHASCCDSHSHLSIMYQSLGYEHSPHIVTRRSIEPFRFIPEVFLDPFIPPAELA